MFFDAHRIDPFGSAWIGVVSRAVAATTAVRRWAATDREVLRHVADVRRCANRLTSERERLIGTVRSLVQRLEHAKIALDDAVAMEREATQALDEAQARFEDARSALLRCREDNRPLKREHDECFQSRKRCSQGRAAARRTVNRATGRVRRASAELKHYRGLLKSAKSRANSAQHLLGELERLSADIGKRGKSAEAAAANALDELERVVGELDKFHALAEQRRAELIGLASRVSDARESMARTLGAAGSGEPREPPGALPLSEQARAGLRLLDAIGGQCTGRGEGDEQGGGVDAIRPDYDAMSSLCEAVHSKHKAWLRQLLGTVRVIVGAATDPTRYWVSTPSGERSTLDAGGDVLITDLDLGAKMRQLTGPYRSVVLASGTLKPVGPTAQLLGWRGATTETFASPFSDGNYACYAVVGAHSGGQGPGRMSARERRLLRACVPDWVSAIGRNTAIFVASEDLLADLYTDLRRAKGWPAGVRHLVLSQGNQGLQDDYVELAAEAGACTVKSLGPDGDQHWQRILKGGTTKQVVVWMAASGKFAEGTDFPGEMLEAAILVGIPFPYQMDLKEMIKARSRYYTLVGGSELGLLAEELAWYVSPYRKLAQAAGRIHRDVEDQGTLVFIDERLLGLKGGPGPRSSESVRASLEILPDQVQRRLAVVVPGSLHAHRSLIEEWLTGIVPGAPIVSPDEALGHVRRGTHPRD